MKLGINTYTLMWSIGFRGPNPDFPNHAARPPQPLTLFDLLETTRRLDLRLLQTGPNLLVESLSAAEQERWIAQARDWGIELELGTRGLDYDHIVEQVALAQRMDAKLIRTIPELNGRYLLEAEALAAALEPLVPLLADHRLRLGIENGRMPAAPMRDTLERLGSDRVGVVLDMVNSLAVPEGWQEVTRILAPYVVCLHYKDFTIRRAWHMMGFLCDGTPAGQGMVDTGWLLRQLRAARQDFNVILELWPPEQETIEETIALEQSWLVESIAYLRQYIQNELPLE